MHQPQTDVCKKLENVDILISLSFHCRFLGAEHWGSSYPEHNEQGHQQISPICQAEEEAVLGGILSIKLFTQDYHHCQ